MPEYIVIPDLRFPGRYFLTLLHNGKTYGASFVGRRSHAEDAILTAVARDEKVR